MQALIATLLVFGVGNEAPSRYSPIMASVNSSFLRRSGVRNADANAVSTHPPARVRFVSVLWSSSGHRPAPLPQVDPNVGVAASLTAGIRWRRPARDGR